MPAAPKIRQMLRNVLLNLMQVIQHLRIIPIILLYT
jgi:hypothetical protein